MSIDRRSADVELGGDLRDGVLLLAVVAGLVVHLACQLDLPRSELGSLAAGAAAGAGRGKAVHGSLGHERMFEFCDRAEDLEEHPAHGSGGVDPLVQHDEVDPAGLQ